MQTSAVIFDMDDLCTLDKLHKEHLEKTFISFEYATFQELKI